jgi:hypothetical protein
MDKALLLRLTERLLELEWKIERLHPFPYQSLPVGLFRQQSNTGLACIAEIKSQIELLSSQANLQCQSYLAEKILQQINVLVALCGLENTRPKQAKANSFDLRAITTRQQRIQDLEAELQKLGLQQQAMQQTLMQMQKAASPLAILNAQKELGALEKRLTLARDTLHHVCYSS